MTRTPTRDHQPEDVLGKAYDAKLMVWLWRFVKPHWRLLLASLMFIPITTFFDLAQPYIIKIAIDSHIAARDLHGLGGVVLLYLGAVILGALGSFGELWFLQLLGQKSMHALRLATYRHVVRLRSSYFDRVPTGRILTRMTNDIENINEMFASGVVTIVADLVRLIAIVITMLVLNYKLALLTFSTIPLLIALVIWARNVMRTSFREIRVKLAAMNALVAEHIVGIRVVQLFRRERRAQRDYDQLNHEYRNAYLGAIRADSAMYAVVEAIGIISGALIAWYSGYNIGEGALTVGLVVAFIEYVNRFFAPVRDLSTKYAVMQSAMAAAERIAGLLETDEPDAPKVVAPPVPAVPADVLIRFDNLSFSYQAGEEVLRGVSFDIRRGETVAVVGATGSGKSTLIRLLARLYDPSGGAVLFDGKDVRDYRPEDLRRRITAVSQDVVMFSGTVGENVRLGKLDATDEAVHEALQTVGATRILRGQGKIEEMRVTERGNNFSAGERQLIAFARALLRDSEVLVLDEATAQIDPETESVIETALKRLLSGRTTLVIAHRLSTVRRADRIVVLSRGQVAEQGSRKELLERGGLYAALEKTFASH